jgi:hypothetical protein
MIRAVSGDRSTRVSRRTAREIADKIEEAYQKRGWLAD